MGNPSPNILVLMTDQQRADTIHPGHICRTPAMDRLIAGGVHFPNARTPNSICSPARASLMTGVYPSAHGIADCVHASEPYRADLQDGYPFWSQILHEGGYAGGYFGKWHIERSGDPLQFGFDKFVPEHSQAYAAYRQSMNLSERIWHKRYILQHKGYKDRPVYGVYEEPVQATGAYYLCSQAIDFIREHSGGGRPWMTFVSLLEPHDPYYALKTYYDRYENDSIEVPDSWDDPLTDKPRIIQRMRNVWSGMSPLQVREAIRCYYALCSQIDEQAGRVLQALEDTGQLDNTWIIVTADHGDMLGEQGLFLKGITPYEGVYRVPLVISGPGIKEPGRSCGACASLVDLAPTITEIAFGQAMAGVHGNSLLPLLTGDQVVDRDGQKRHWNEGFAEFHGQRYAYTQRIVWYDRYKYIFNGFDDDELYDLEADPQERRNLAADAGCSDLVEAMASRMWRHIRIAGDKTMLNANYGTLRFAPTGPEG